MTAVRSGAEVRAEAKARLLAAMEGLPLSISGGSYDQNYVVIAANENRHMAISEELALLFPVDKPYPTLRDALEAFARGDNEIKYLDGYGHENTLVLWSPEMEQRL